MTYFLKLIDTTEPSNIIAPKIGELVFWDKDIEPKGLVNNGWSYKLLVLCSDEAIDKSKDKYLDLTHGIIMNGVFVGSSDGNVKKVISTNSPTKTPNCYISEDRVKEFVEYWNKYKELPKFQVMELPKNIGGFEQGFELLPTPKITINNILQIKWLPKEEERERGITITSLSSKILETKEQIFEYFENNYGWEFKKIDEYQIQLFKGFDFLYQYHSKENIETIHSIQRGFSFDLPINSDEIDIVMKAFSIKHK